MSVVARHARAGGLRQVARSREAIQTDSVGLTLRDMKRPPSGATRRVSASCAPSGRWLKRVGDGDGVFSGRLREAMNRDAPSFRLVVADIRDVDALPAGQAPTAIASQSSIFTPDTRTRPVTDPRASSATSTASPESLCAQIRPDERRLMVTPLATGSWRSAPAGQKIDTEVRPPAARSALRTHPQTRSR